MGYEGAYMCKWSITNGEFWMTPEELYDSVIEDIEDSRTSEREQVEYV